MTLLELLKSKVFWQYAIVLIFFIASLICIIGLGFSGVKHKEKPVKKTPEFTQGQKVYVIKDYKNGVIKTCDLLSVHKDYTGEIDDYTLGVWNSKGTIIHLENVKKEQVFASLEEASNAYLQFREHFGHILDHLEDGK